MIGASEIKTENYCSPKAIKEKKKDGITCFNYETLVLIAQLYNNSHSDKIEIGTKKTKKKLWNAINDKMKPVCGSKKENCWIDQPFVQATPKYDKLKTSFKPKKPESWEKNPREWLNTFDILDVMKQYEEADKTFHFIGVFPIDFASKNSASGQCIVNEMCKLNLKDEWHKGIRKIGVVFNTDDSKSSGSHWLGCHIGLNPKSKNFGIYFYDSVGMNPQKEIVVFMKQMKKELEELQPKYKDKIEYRINKVRKQYKGTECGMFSCLFQILMLKHKYDDICNNMGKDDEVNQFRDILYRPLSPTTK
jgi:hypothetical protein